MSCWRKTTAQLLLVVVAGIASLVCQPAQAQLDTVVLHVHGDAGDLPPPSGIATGEEWGLLAFRFLQDAIAEALLRLQEPDVEVEIWVAATDPGNPYRPDRNAAFGGTGDETSTVALHDRIRFFGGFEGDEANLMDRDPENNATVISGVLGFEFAPPCGDMAAGPSRRDR